MKVNILLLDSGHTLWTCDRLFAEGVERSIDEKDC